MARYIDADVLRELIDEGYDLDFSELPETKRELLHMIDYQETADVREVKHGHWIRSDWNGAHIRYTCSNCQLSVLSSEDYMRKHRFCFGCGAIMDEEVSDGK